MAEIKYGSHTYGKDPKTGQYTKNGQPVPKENEKYIPQGAKDILNQGSSSSSGGGGQHSTPASSGGANTSSGGGGVQQGWAYTDKYGFSHVVKDYETAVRYGQPGSIMPYNGPYKYGYAINEHGERMAVPTPGARNYGNYSPSEDPWETPLMSLEQFRAKFPGYLGGNISPVANVIKPELKQPTIIPNAYNTPQQGQQQQQIATNQNYVPTKYDVPSNKYTPDIAQFGNEISVRDVLQNQMGYQVQYDPQTKNIRITDPQSGRTGTIPAGGYDIKNGKAYVKTDAVRSWLGSSGAAGQTEQLMPIEEQVPWTEESLLEAEMIRMQMQQEMFKNYLESLGYNMEAMYQTPEDWRDLYEGVLDMQSDSTDAAIKEAMRQAAISGASRGIWNSGIQSQLENEARAAIMAQAQQNAMMQAMQMAGIAMDERKSAMNLLASQMASAQQYTSQTARFLREIFESDRSFTFEEKKLAIEEALRNKEISLAEANWLLSEAALTGIYKGQPTLDKIKMDRDYELAQAGLAIDRTRAARSGGDVTTPLAKLIEAEWADTLMKTKPEERYQLTASIREQLNYYVKNGSLTGAERDKIIDNLQVLYPPATDKNAGSSFFTNLWNRITNPTTLDGGWWTK